MRSVSDDVVASRLLAGSDLFGLASDLDHRITESVDLRQRLGLGRLDEHTGRDRPTASRRVHAEVLLERYA